MEFFDTHCHLGDRAFGGDREEVIARARRAGVTGMLCVGYDVRSSRAALALARRHEGLWAAVGVHPHYSANMGRDWVDDLRRLAAEPKVAAIGETGLDFYRDLSPRETQRDIFRRHIDLARELDLPLIVHDRDAHDEILTILLQSFGTPGSETAPVAGRDGAGVMHCFSGDAAMATLCLDIGFYISFAGPLTYPKADKTRAAASSVPIDRLLLETDSPYLSPQGHRGQRNEPAHIPLIAAAVATLKGVSLERVAAATTTNAARLLHLGVGRPGAGEC